ncbi:MAG: histidine kinase, partial [Desulfobacterales bacterium]|nr:histidine kinase [Desulfobacterales bacterium]
CRKIVTSLLDFARQTRPNKQANDINAVVAESVLLTKKQAAFKDIDVNQELEENIPRVHVDKGQIQQALINLVLNAVESTDAGGRITIRTKHAAPNREVEIVVTDTGEGIADEALDKIFDPFFTTKDDGSGLGLAITHGIIEQHGGTIDVRSEPGAGASFTIKLPIDKGEGHDV